MCKKVVVIGGGISGLACAWSLARGSSRLNVVLLEGTSRTGGWVQSDRIAHTGAVHELGPRSLRVAGKSGKIALAVLSEVGLESQIIPVSRGHAAAQRRLIYTDQHKLVELPSNASWLFTKKPPFSGPLFYSVMKELFINPSVHSAEDESVHEFIAKRFGREIADWIIDPMCCGIFAGDSKRLSLRSCFPLFYNYKKEHGSILRGMITGSQDRSGVEDNELVIKAKKNKWMIYSLKNGLQTLTDALHAAAESLGVDICTDTLVTGLSFDNGQIKVTTENDEHVADHVISTIPAKSLAKVLIDGSQSKLSSLLSSIPAVDVAVANLEYDGQVISKQWRQAFGYLVPSHQNSNILGTVFDSSTFPELDRKDKPSTRLTVMMGGEWFEELFGDPDTVKVDTVTKTALKSLYSQLDIKQDPIDCNISIQKQCIPQYIVGHNQKLDEINECIKGLPLSLLGSSYSGVSVNDCIMNSVIEAKTVLSNME